MSVDYDEYIQSEEWRQRANEAKRHAGYRCRVCNRSSKEVVLNAHHRTYKRLGYEDPDDITVLCRDCHELYELNKKIPRPPHQRYQPIGILSALVNMLKAVAVSIMAIVMPYGIILIVIAVFYFADSFLEQINITHTPPPTVIHSTPTRERNTVTPLSTPVSPTSTTLPTRGCPGGCRQYPDWCEPPIKGNIGKSSGEKIYHVFGQAFYDDTIISPRYGERWFCTEEEAKAAGWRKSRQ